MTLIERVKAILLTPKLAWPVIEHEPDSARQLYTGYLMPLAAIPAVAAFIGLSVIGTTVFGVTYRVPLAAGLSQMVVSYALSLVSMYLLSLIINFLAPRFGGTANPLNALKVAVYGATASMLGGIFALLPSLTLLGTIAGLYSIYLVYLGLPVLMKNPQENSVAYTAVTIVCAIALAIVIGLVSAAVLPRSVLGGNGALYPIDPEAGTAQFQQLGHRAAKAAESGRPEDVAAAIGDAMAEVFGAVTSAQPASPATGNVAAAVFDSAESSVEIPPIPDAPDAAVGPDPVIDSPYGLGKKKLGPPPPRARCLSQEEYNEALSGSGCDCSCTGYAKGPGATCQTACGLSYYNCWAPDPDDAEMAAKIDDPAARLAIATLGAAERAQYLQFAKASEMLNRADAWMKRQQCAE